MKKKVTPCMAQTVLTPYQATREAAIAKVAAALAEKLANASRVSVAISIKNLIKD